MANVSSPVNSDSEVSYTVLIKFKANKGANPDTVWQVFELAMEDLDNDPDFPLSPTTSAVIEVKRE